MEGKKTFMKYPNLSVLLLALFLSLIPFSDVFACSCGPRPTVLDSFESANLVVAARLVSVEITREKEGEYDIHHIRSSTMVVSKVYKGNVKQGQTLKFAQGGGADCIWTFDEEDVDREFLFYLGEYSHGDRLDPNEDERVEMMYSAVSCGRSNSITGATDDLSYLNNLEKVKGKTRVAGTIGAWWTPDEFNRGGINITIRDRKKTIVKTKTDAKGFFEIYDIPPGEYFLDVGTPFGWKINDYMLEQAATGFEPYHPRSKRVGLNQIPILIKKGGHVSLDLLFDIDTAITGRVLSPLGKPMKNVCLTAVSTKLEKNDLRGRFDCTNEKGEFVIDEMSAGNYILVVNKEGLIDEHQPFGKLYYPGVPDLESAGVITVEPGKYSTGVTIQIPQLVELVEVKGRFLFSDGKPVGNEWVDFYPDDKNKFDEMRTKSDGSGNFVFRIPKGATGKISGEISTYRGKFEDCPKLESIIEATGRTFLAVKSSVASANSLVPPSQLEISLPFPFCEEKKK